MRMTLRIAAVAAPTVFVLAACASTPTVSTSPLPETPSETGTSVESTEASNSGSSQQNSTQPETLGPAATIANKVGCGDARAEGASLATASTVYCTDGERGYVITVYGSKGKLNAQFKKLENSVKETGETISIVLGSNWILRGSESQQIGSKMEASAGAAGGRVVTFADQGAVAP